MKIKTSDKYLAFFLIIFLLSLTQVAAMPATDSAVAAYSGPHAEEGQGLIEVEGDYASGRYRKSSAVPIIIGLLAAGAVAAVLFLVVLKTKYNLVGTWNIVVKAPGYADRIGSMTFSGDKKSGTFRDDEGDTGVYSVDGENVAFSYDYFEWTFSGKFMDKNSMSGQHDFENGTWSATRAGASISASTAAAPLSTTSNPYKKITK